MTRRERFNEIVNGRWPEKEDIDAIVNKALKDSELVYNEKDTLITWETLYTFKIKK